MYEGIHNDLAGNAWFDPENSTISVFFKGRGIGDYGSLMTYRFDNGVTTLIVYRQKSEPDENVDIDNIPSPDDWPMMTLASSIRNGRGILESIYKTLTSQGIDTNASISNKRRWPR
jgi:hypothetical protein